MELRTFFIGAILVMFAAAGLVNFYSSIGVNYGVQNLTNLSTTQSFNNMQSLYAQTSAATDTNSTSGQTINLYGIPTALAFQFYAWLMLLFQLPNVLNSMVDDMLGITGLGVELGWAIMFLKMLILAVVMFAIGSAILKWRT